MVTLQVVFSDCIALLDERKKPDIKTNDEHVSYKSYVYMFVFKMKERTNTANILTLCVIQQEFLDDK